jgi:hypothetical protein
MAETLPGEWIERCGAAGNERQGLLFLVNAISYKQRNVGMGRPTPKSNLLYFSIPSRVQQNLIKVIYDFIYV